MNFTLQKIFIRIKFDWQTDTRDKRGKGKITRNLNFKVEQGILVGRSNNKYPNNSTAINELFDINISKEGKKITGK